jgi:hypothetical protein
MLANVVKSLPAIRSITRRPRAPSRRSPDAVIDPSGNATAAAISSRSGVSGVIFSGGGIEAMAQQHIWAIPTAVDMEVRPTLLRSQAPHIVAAHGALWHQGARAAAAVGSDQKVA